ncbi:capsid protein [Chifec virus UA13_1727]|uniref:Capsid protein n=1 Tax=Chifec virus UA13_1727 TaxID=2914454 RepID=A0AAX3A7C3_9CIRC|nr:capsid protein [Chifec virus UA13_1727]UNY50593.1 capsid protein [Chifec virus UA13_1727]
MRAVRRVFARRRLALRKPVRRTIFRRRFGRRIRRRRQATLYCKITRTIHASHPLKDEYNLPLHVTLNDFSEHVNLAATFERVKVLRQVVTVYPQQNVSNTSTSRVGGYCLVPYHKTLPTTYINYPTALSVDKAKAFRATQTGRMSFVPCSRLVVENSAGAVSVAYQNSWKPEFEITAENTIPQLYTGFICFESLAQSAVTAYYTIKQDLYVKYKNQRSFI